MHRVLFEVGPLTIYTYGVAVALAFLAGIWFTVRRGPVFGYSREIVSDASVPILLSVLAGAKLAYLAIHASEISFGWRELISLARGGFVFYGGLVGGVVGGAWWLKRRGVPILPFGDLAAAPLCFAHAIGRLGCWFNGCCYGKPASWGFVQPEVDALPRVPTQLIETGGLAALGLVLLAIKPDPVRGGRVLGFYVIGYALLRFVVEILRADPRGDTFLSLSVSQWVSVASLLAGLILLVRFRRAPS